MYDYPKYVYEYRNKVMGIDRKELLEEMSRIFMMDDTNWYHKTFLREAAKKMDVYDLFRKYFGE